MSAAREARTAAKKLVDAGQDPSRTKKVAKAARIVANATTFDALAAELLQKKRREAKAETTISKIEWLLSFAKPVIGQRPIGEITAPEILAVLRTIEARGRHETARRLRSTIGEVFRYAVTHGHAQGDPTSALRSAMAAPVVKHREAIVDPRRFEVDRELSRLIEIEDGAFTAVCAYPAKTMQEAGAKAEYVIAHADGHLALQEYQLDAFMRSFLA